MYTVIMQRDPYTLRAVYIVYRVTRDATGRPVYTAVYSHINSIVAHFKARKLNNAAACNPQPAKTPAAK